MRYRSPQKIKNMIKPDYSLYLNKPQMLDWIESEWLAHPEIHDSYAKAINDVIKKYNCKTVTEFGCGSGEVARRIKNVQYLGCDVNESVLALARKKSDHEFRMFDIRAVDSGVLPQSDIVCAFAFLKHFGLHEWPSIFKRVCSLGKKMLVFDMPIAEQTKDDGLEYHHVWMSSLELLTHITDNGFNVIETRKDNPIEPLFICKRK